MEQIDYSVVIRTLGLAGEKYRKMLESIDKQTIKPREIVVVLAEGYALPPEQLGYERFVFSKKGIVTQRSLGAKEAKGKYCLFLDDDMQFEPDMVEVLFKPIRDGIADVTFPLIPEMLPQGGGKIVSAVTGTAIPMIFGTKENYVRLLRSGTWSYNKNIDMSSIHYYKAQSAPGGCYLARREAALKIKFEEEDWLEKTSFSLPDDQINFYKYHVLGYKIIGISNINILHLDAGGNGHDRKLKAVYALSKHRTIFWHRFIYKNDSNSLSRILSIICFSYPLVASLISGALIALFRGDLAIYKQQIKGLKDGFAFLTDPDYTKLPVVIKKNYQ